MLVLQTLPYIPTITNYTKLWWVPNVVVVHEKEGIEAIHLATGRTVCKVIEVPYLCCFRVYILEVLEGTFLNLYTQGM